MSFIDKVKESLANHAAAIVAASLTAMLAWAASEIAPAILPTVEAVISKKVLLALFVASIALNLIFGVIVWLTSKKEPFRLMYGIYWDKNKNPHCPSCKIPVASYNNYSGERGYYCKPCKTVFSLSDATGTDIDPAQVLGEL